MKAPIEDNNLCCDVVEGTGENLGHDIFEKTLYEYGHRIFEREHHPLVGFIVETDGIQISSRANKYLKP